MPNPIQFTIPDNDFVQLSGAGSSGYFIHQGGVSDVGNNVFIVESQIKPEIDIGNNERFKELAPSLQLPVGEYLPYFANGTLWAISTSGDNIITSVPNGLYDGMRAQTVQFYTEANVKNGVQFYLRKAYTLQTPIGSGQSRYLVFSTTSKKVIFKSRIVSYIGEEFALELFVNPDLSNNGQPITVGNYNGINPVATTVQAYHAPVIVSEGTPLYQEAEYYFGGSSAGQRVSNSIPEGRERVLPENTTFLIKITNTGSGNGRFQYFGDWYEGDPDLPLA